MKHIGYAFLVLPVLFAGSLRAQSQGFGTLTGLVVDYGTHAPIPAVLVWVTSPQLQGEQAVKTDSTGTYLIPQLPPGVYMIRFERELYRPFSQGDIALDADRTLRINAKLRTEHSSDE